MTDPAEKKKLFTLPNVGIVVGIIGVIYTLFIWQPIPCFFGMCDGNLDKEIENVIDARRAELANVLFISSQTQTCTVGGSGKKTAAMNVECPSYAEKAGEATRVAQGGCYGFTQTARGATGTVSQTGDGKTSCAIKVACKLSASEISQRLVKDRLVLDGATKETLSYKQSQLSPIEYDNTSKPSGDCHRS